MELKKTNAVDLYFNINLDVFPITSKLQIFITLLMLTATEERPFSLLRCLKTYLGN